MRSTSNLFFSAFKISVLILLLFFLAACGGKKRNPLSNLRSAPGGVYYGGSFHYNEVTNLRSLYPLDLTDVVSSRLASQIYEGLVRFSTFNLTIEPALASRWEIDSTNTIYTFHLREGVLFHNDDCFPERKGRELTAYDVKWCFDKLCESSPQNQGYSFVEGIIQGSEKHYEASLDGSISSSEGVSGVRVIDDYTIEIHLARPYSNLLNILATAYGFVYPEEAYIKYGVEMRRHCVGTGPFMLKDFKEDKAIILLRHENYWGKDDNGNQLPYLDAIKVSFIVEQKSEFLEFTKGNLDMVYRLPLEMMDEIVDHNRDLKEPYTKYQLQMSPGLVIQYYGFQHKSELFSNKKVRQAFNYAIDRRKIVDFTLKGTGIASFYGVVPPALIGYDAKAVKGFDFDADRGRQLLAEGGYPNGENFPEITLQISAAGGRNEQVAEAIVKMLEENLNVHVNIYKLPLAQHYLNVETGKALFWRSGWRADFPDAETFMTIFYGRHVPDKLEERAYLNPVRYQSERFDSMLSAARGTVNEAERFELYLKADQILMDDAVIVPIYSDRDFRLLLPYVRNMHQNPMEYRNFAKVFFDPKYQETQ